MGISSRPITVIEGIYIAGNITVSTNEVEAKVGTTALEGRQQLIIFNGGTENIYFGPEGVTESNGIPIKTQETRFLPFGESIRICLVTASGSNIDVVIQELG